MPASARLTAARFASETDQAKWRRNCLESFRTKLIWHQTALRLRLGHGAVLRSRQAAINHHILPRKTFLHANRRQQRRSPDERRQYRHAFIIQSCYLDFNPNRLDDTGHGRGREVHPVVLLPRLTDPPGRVRTQTRRRRFRDQSQRDRAK